MAEWVFENNILHCPNRTCAWLARSGGARWHEERLEACREYESDRKDDRGYSDPQTRPAPYSSGRLRALPPGIYTIREPRSEERLNGWKKSEQPKIIDKTGHRWFVPLRADASIDRDGFGIHPDGG